MNIMNNRFLKVHQDVLMSIEDVMKFQEDEMQHNAPSTKHRCLMRF